MIKYPSFENYDKEKNVAYWLHEFPELAQEEYCLSEKIHGSNI